MAKSKKNSNKKKKRGLQQMINPQTYFLSDKLRNLPIDAYYLGYETIEGISFINVCITRSHVNGNKSFSVFKVDDFTGEIFDIVFDYNADSADLDELFEHFDLEPSTIEQAIEYLIFAAEQRTLELGQKLPEDFRFAKRILAGDKQTVLESSEHLEKLATFQMGVSEKSRSETQTATRLPYGDLSYDPTTVRRWTRADWTHFMENDLTKDPEVFLYKSLSPLLYIYEMLYLPNADINPKIGQALDRLSELKTILTPTDNDLAELDYEINEEQREAEAQLWPIVDKVTPDSNINFLQGALNGYINEFPGNPVFYRQRYQIYLRTGQYNMTLKTAAENYRLFPDSPAFLIQYLMELILNKDNEKKRLKDLFQKGYLIEDHFAEGHVFNINSYLIYYQLLGQYLVEKNLITEYWLLAEIIKKLPEFKASNIMIKAWNGLNAWPATTVMNTLIHENQKGKDKHINDILQFRQPLDENS